MGMYDDFLKVINYIKSDETLLRLLYYPPEDLGNGVLDPLDASLPSILDMDIKTRSDIINLRIVRSAKYSDLQNEEICRIYVYAGARSSNNSNYLTAKQNIQIDILCNSNYENGDLRSLRIADRLNELFTQERLLGIGQMDFAGARPINAPYEYIGYQVAYNYATFKK